MRDNNIIDKKVIFVDFFDTIMHRHIHPLAVLDRAKQIAESDKDKNYEAILKCVEIGCQYPDKHLIDIIKNAKESGKNIYIVSDFHMGKECYIDFLMSKNINPKLFDDIFVSCECGCSKADGDLYPYVLDKVGAKASDVLMIGDNKKVDGQNAKRYGIDSLIIPHYWKKAIIQAKRFFLYDYKRVAAKCVRKDLYNYGGPFSEYALLFYLSTRELYRHLFTKQQKNVVFLAREGHFLKRAFDAYNNIFVSEEDTIKSSYLKCSRRAAQSLLPESLSMLENSKISIYDYLMAHGFSNQEIESMAIKYGVTDGLHDCSYLNQNDSFMQLMNYDSFRELIQKKRHDNQIAGRKYFESYKTGDVINLVDIGWKGSMQDTIGKILKMNTMGYYIGVNDSNLDLNNRIGLLFTSCPKQGVISPWSQILKANIQLYEQLSSAPHGSAVGYLIKDEKVSVAEDWVENERQLFFDKIESIQKQLILNILGLAAWCNDVPYSKLLKLCAKTVLCSGLFADKTRIEFIRSLDNGFVWNFNSQTKSLKYDKKSVKIRLDLLTSPEKYTRYFVKLQRSLYSKGLFAQIFYYPIAAMFYTYVWSISCLKELTYK